MNQAYKLVWDEMRRMLVIVAENSSRRGKKTGKGGGRALVAPVFALTLAAGMLAPMGAGDAWAAFVCTSTDSSVAPGKAEGTNSVACGMQTGTAVGHQQAGAWAANSIALGTNASAGLYGDA